MAQRSYESKKFYQYRGLSYLCRILIFVAVLQNNRKRVDFLTLFEFYDYKRHIYLLKNIVTIFSEYFTYPKYAEITPKLKDSSITRDNTENSVPCKKSNMSRLN